MITNLIESVLDPQGRFRNLKDVYPSANGHDPGIFSGPGYCDIEVTVDGEPAVMRCYYRRDARLRERLSTVSSCLAALDEPFYNRFVYLENELLVFDDNYGHSYIDVSMELRPGGIPFAGLSTAPRYDIVPLHAWLKGFIPRHAVNGISHGNISARTLFTGAGPVPLLAGFDKATRGDVRGDVAALVLIGCILSLAVTDRRALHLFDKQKMPPEKMLETLRSLPSSGSFSPINAVLELALSPGTDTVDMVDAFGKLPVGQVHPGDSVSLWLDSVLPVWDAGSGSRDVRAGKYEFVGELSDNMMRAFDGRGWCYLDRSGAVCLPGPYDEADDFYEGLARVGRAGCFGVVNRYGRFVLDPVFDEIEVDRESNRIIAMVDGLYGIADREGCWLTGLHFTAPPVFTQGVFLVEKDNLYGYLDRNGQQVTAIKFDEAGTFADGRPGRGPLPGPQAGDRHERRSNRRCGREEVSVRGNNPREVREGR